MIDYTKSFARTKYDFDQGLRDYMIKVYQYMAMALLITAVMAYCSFNFPPLTSMLYQLGPNGEFAGFTAVGIIFAFVPLGISIFFFMKIGSLSIEKSHAIFWIYAATMGISLSYLGLVYTGHSLIRTFFITSSVFGAMSIYGYTTKKDLTSFGSFLVMGLVGILVASLVNIFLQSSALEFAVSLIGVGVFMGLIAWDVQKLKHIYYSVGGDSEMGQKMAVVGAFTLYLDFINLFLHLLRFLGDRKE